MTDRRRCVLAGAVGLVAVTLFVSACGGSGKSGTSNTSAAASETTAVAPGDSTAQPASVDSEAVNVLTGALAKLGTSYHFLTTVRVGDAVALTAEGDRIADGARLSLTSDAGVVSYVIVGPDSWAKPENGSWSKLDVPPANADPVGALVKAVTASIVKTEGSTTTLELGVANADLGIAGEGTASVTVQVADGVLVFVVYATTVADKPALVTAELSAPRDESPVTAPADE